MLYHMLGQAQPTYLSQIQRQHFQDMMYELDSDKRCELIEDLQKTILKQKRLIIIAHPKAQSSENTWIYHKDLQGLVDPRTHEALIMQSFVDLYKSDSAQEQTKQ